MLVPTAFNLPLGQIERLLAGVKEEKQRYAVMEDRDEYLAANVFWVPKEARWEHLQAKAKQPTIGKLIDDAMVAIEKENESRFVRESSLRSGNP